MKTAATLAVLLSVGTSLLLFIGPVGSSTHHASAQEAQGDAQRSLEEMRREQRLRDCEFLYRQLKNAFQTETGGAEFPATLEAVVAELGDKLYIPERIEGDIVYYGPTSWDGESESDKILFHMRTRLAGERVIVFADGRVEVAAQPRRMNVEPPR